MNFKKLFCLVMLSVGSQAFGAAKKEYTPAKTAKKENVPAKKFMVVEHSGMLPTSDFSFSQLSWDVAKRDQSSSFLMPAPVIKTEDQIMENLIMTDDFIALDKDNRTALMRAVIFDQANVFNFLLDNRVKNDHKGKDGKSFFDLVMAKPETSKVSKAYRKFIIRLVDKIGAAKTMKNNQGKVVSYLPESILFLIAEYGI